jgi:hypothetical protein
MTDLDRQIRARVEAFAEELTLLVRKAALRAVSDALGGRAPTDAKAKAVAKGAGRKRAKGQKRSSGELDKLAQAIVACVAANPGSGAREIALELGVTTKDLVLPIKKLMAETTLSSKGQKRATKYYRGKK